MLFLICLDSYSESSKPKEHFYRADSDEENGPGATQGNVRKKERKRSQIKVTFNIQSIMSD